MVSRKKGEREMEMNGGLLRMRDLRKMLSAGVVFLLQFLIGPPIGERG